MCHLSTCRWLLLLLVVAVAACDKTPTGRRQLTLIPESQIERLGVQTFARIKRTQPMEVSPQINALVRCVAKTIIDMLPNQQSPWEVVVFRDAQPNAFVLPGGKIGINTGILRVTENPAQLATIIGHEVAHVLADHANERMTQELGIQAVFYLLRFFGNDEGDWQRELVEKGLGLGARYGVLLPYSRIHEQEADVLGLQLMARAGFDPRASLDFWQNMAQVSRDQPPELMSTHPSHNSRVETLQAEMDQALELQQAARKAGRQPGCALP